jgi:hypothetical protein
MRGFAVVAYKRVEFDADVGEAKLLGCATVGTFAVGWKASQLANFLFGWSQRHCLVINEILSYCILEGRLAALTSLGYSHLLGLLEK